jgi:hypothetical protein
MSEGDQLPNCQNARVVDAKLYKYLLNLNHPDGKSKARFFELAGYITANGKQLRADLLRLACWGKVTKQMPNPEGVKYVVVGSIDAPNGKTYELLTVWAVEPPDHEPRLITAYPN